MALPFRPRMIPQCSTCLRSYAFKPMSESAATSAINQQVRGKKKLANNFNTVPVRLLKNVKTFGRRGAIVPISIGQMRNNWFPRNVAEYITLPERKTLKIQNITAERDFDYGVTDLAQEAAAMGAVEAGPQMSGDAKMDASMFQKKVESTRLSSERSMELLEIFVPKAIEFWRQPILEEKEPEPEPEPKRPMRGFGTGAGAELLAARAAPDARKGQKSANATQAIYGSVSTTDVLNAVKAAMATNDEAARVLLHAEDVRFVTLTDDIHSETDRVKFAGDYVVEITAKGSGDAIKRLVRVHAQEA